MIDSLGTLQRMPFGEPRVGLRVRVWRDYWHPFLAPQRGRIGHEGVIDAVNDQGRARIRWSDDSYRLASATLVPVGALIPVLDERGQEQGVRR